jgi:hypothetical protein
MFAIIDPEFKDSREEILADNAYSERREDLQSMSIKELLEIIDYSRVPKETWKENLVEFILEHDLRL